ncbi:MAG: hypothetical protein ACXVXE_11135 [Nocardioidaceae bacterium]
MNFGVLLLIVLCAWSLVSIIASLVFGAMADARDTEPGTDGRPLTIAAAMDHHPAAASHRRHLAS